MAGGAAGLRAAPGPRDKNAAGRDRPPVVPCRRTPVSGLRNLM